MVACFVVDEARHSAFLLLAEEVIDVTAELLYEPQELLDGGDITVSVLCLHPRFEEVQGICKLLGHIAI